MKTNDLALKAWNVATYNATMASPAMQAILTGVIAAEKARKAAEAERVYQSLFRSAEEIAAEEAKDEHVRAVREEAIELGWGE